MRLALLADACRVRVAPAHVEQVIVHLALNARVPGTGAGLARRWLTTRPGACVLFMSGYTDHPESLGLGPDSDLLTKPFTPGALLDRVRALLDRGAGRGTPATAGPSGS